MQPQQPNYGQPSAPTPNYDFIINPSAPPKKRLLNFDGGNSVIIRVIMVLGGLLVLLILFSVVKGVLGGGKSNTTSLLRVAQSQQELVHLSTNALTAQGVGTPNLNFASTTQLSLNSQYTQLVSYMSKNHQKLNPKLLNAGISTSVDNQLTASVTAGTYDSTFKQVMQTQLTEYQQVLRQAYSQTTGPKGKKLLNDDYNAAQLLQKQLGN